jgi:hypothetical protein
MNMKVYAPIGYKGDMNMKVYAPIGYYNDPQDIIDLYPNSTFKGDEADNIVKYQQDGYGNFHTFGGTPGIEACYTTSEALCDNNVVFASDDQHLVRFTRGNMKLLQEGNDMHGFFIDIYEFVDIPGLPEKTPEKKDITKMTYDELCAYTLDLTEKMKEAVSEIKLRESKKSK